MGAEQAWSCGKMVSGQEVWVAEELEQVAVLGSREQRFFVGVCRNVPPPRSLLHSIKSPSGLGVGTVAVSSSFLALFLAGP